MKRKELPKLTSQGPRFVDATGRQVLLRGLNLGGDCKVPYPDGGTQHASDFADHRTVSFVGRPFPLDEAPEHFARIAGWGFNCLRLLTTWEAVEHAGPGQYDRAYIEYYARLCEMAGEYGLYVFVDFHQDVWSRMSGGDGAPGWVFEAVGLDFTKFDAAGAALVMQHRFDYADPRDRQPENYPTMCWSQNYMYPANAMLWTLFFAGRDFAPDCIIKAGGNDGENVQDFLQNSYLGAMREIAKAVAGQSHVIGFDSLNEPSSGWIGRPFARRILRDSEKIMARPGYALSPRDGLRLARGESVDVEFLDISFLRGRLHPARTETLNAEGVPLWLPGREDDPFGFEAHGRDLPEDYFQKVHGREVDFDRDYLFPFVSRVADCVRAIRADWLIFAEKDAFETMSHPDWPAPQTGAQLPAGVVNAGHWYDGLSLLLKKYPYPLSFDVIYGRSVFGRAGIRRMYVRQLRRIQAASEAHDIPTLIGEFGIQYDLDHARAYRQYAAGRRDDAIWKKHNLALELMYDALDELQLNATQWNYTASNRNHPRIGDGWNQEDLSVYSADQSEVHEGGRAVHGFVRPFPRAIAGRLLRTRFQRRRGSYELCFRARLSGQGADAAQPTEVFVPRLQFPGGFEARLNDRSVAVYDWRAAPAQTTAANAASSDSREESVQLAENGVQARLSFDPAAQLLRLFVFEAAPSPDAGLKDRAADADANSSGIDIVLKLKQR